MSDSRESGEGKISAPVPEWAINVSLSDLKTGELPDITANREKEYPSIFRVPESIRKSDPSAYIPQLVAIGPYHHHHKSLLPAETDICKSLEQYKVWSVHPLLSGNRDADSCLACTPQHVVAIGPCHHRKSLPDNDLCKSLEQYKVWSVECLLSGSSHDETQKLIKDCLSELESLAPRIRRCYSADDIGLSRDHDLAELMLLDGCFVLIRLLQKHPEEELRPSCKGDFQGPLLGFPDVWDDVLRDLLKIENQIPLFVLTTLLQKSPKYGTGNVDVIELARDQFKHVRPHERKSFEPAKQDSKGEYPYDHLLHFYYSSRLPESNTTEANGENKSSRCSVTVDRISEGQKVQSENDENKTKVITKYVKILSATELDREGVGFKEWENPKSFVDIKFTNRRISGIRDLEIPRMEVWNDTHHLLRNLVAFEQCSEKIRVRYVSDYIVFMDYLIDDSKDVNLLESGGILVNGMDVKQNVALLFTNLSKGVGFNEYENYLRELYGEVNDYCKSCWHLHRHVAKIWKDHFSSPWSCLSLFAAIVLLVMTGLQTVYTMVDHYNKN